ncbi:uncharacterized protein LOC143227876 [Tachypleus tridentatus]|uniref:uncharacterized protein LOC143227876 n=1 Tax=Tachypleus tridentatus TaxID=6853 RepID=UPI003FCF9AE5
MNVIHQWSRRKISFIIIYITILVTYCGVLLLIIPTIHNLEVKRVAKQFITEPAAEVSDVLNVIEGHSNEKYSGSLNKDTLVSAQKVDNTKYDMERKIRISNNKLQLNDAENDPQLKSRFYENQRDVNRDMENELEDAGGELNDLEDQSLKADLLRKELDDRDEFEDIALEVGGVKGKMEAEHDLNTDKMINFVPKYDDPKVIMNTNEAQNQLSYSHLDPGNENRENGLDHRVEDPLKRYIVSQILEGIPINEIADNLRDYNYKIHGNINGYAQSNNNNNNKGLLSTFLRIPNEKIKQQMSEHTDDQQQQRTNKQDVLNLIPGEYSERNGKPNVGETVISEDLDTLSWLFDRNLRENERKKILSLVEEAHKVSPTLNVEEQMNEVLRLKYENNNRHSFQDSLTAKAVTPNRNIFTQRFNLVDEIEDFTDWKEVDRGLFIYSAFWDNRKNFNAAPFVRIFAVLGPTLTNKEKYFFQPSCLLRSKDHEFPGTVTVVNIDKLHLSVTLICIPFTSYTDVPTAVAIRHEDTKVMPTWITVNVFPGVSESMKRKGRTVMCVKPLYGPFTNKELLSEFFAYYTIIGINHFFVYKYQISHEIINFLNFLKNSGISLTVVPWTIPFTVDATIKTTQLLHRLMRQDCNYRSMYRYEYTVNVDVDEFLVLKKHPNIQNMLWSLSSFGLSGYFTFREVRFCPQLPSLSDFLPSKAQDNQIGNSSLFTLTKLIRKSYSNSWWWRKYIVKPETAEYFGIHFVTKMLYGWKRSDVSPETAIIHHYRDKLCNPKSTQNVFDPSLPKLYGEKMLIYLRAWGFVS